MANNNDARKQIILDELIAACLDATGESLPEALQELITKAKEMSGPVRDDKEDPPTDAEARKFIYNRLFEFLSRERGIGHGAALIYPDELLTAIRKMYPDGVKNYRPISGKRKRFHEVTLGKLVKEYQQQGEQ